MSQTESGSSKRSLVVMLILVLIAGLALGLAYYFYRNQPQPAPIPVAEVPVEAPLALPPLAQTPAPLPVLEAPAPEEPAPPLPKLNESDASVLTELQSLSSASLKLIVPQEILRKFVRAVNAMDEGKVVHEYRPIASPPPPMRVESLGQPQGEAPRQYRLTAENFRRYDEYVTLFAMVDKEALAATYRRFSPLLEEAYSEMGLKKGSFHEVLLSVMDKLIAMPVHEGELLLVQPKVFYQFADPELEKLPSTHKLLLRMGPENARSLQSSLTILASHLR